LRGLAAILEACPARFLLFLKFTGARPGEASQLQWRHIDWDRSIVVLRERGRRLP
jgi:integrase